MIDKRVQTWLTFQINPLIETYGSSMVEGKKEEKTKLNWLTELRHIHPKREAGHVFVHSPLRAEQYKRQPSCLLMTSSAIHLI